MTLCGERPRRDTCERVATECGGYSGTIVGAESGPHMFECALCCHYVSAAEMHVCQCGAKLCPHCHNDVFKPIPDEGECKKGIYMASNYCPNCHRYTAYVKAVERGADYLNCDQYGYIMNDGYYAVCSECEWESELVVLIR